MTWNVQRMSLGTVKKRKARNVTEIAQKNGWDAVLLLEVRSAARLLDLRKAYQRVDK